MIELPTVTRSNGFSYNNETQRNEKNQGAEFSELAKNAGIAQGDSHEVSSDIEEKVDEMSVVSDMEIITYTFLGEKTVFGKFTGGTKNWHLVKKRHVW